MYANFRNFRFLILFTWLLCVTGLLWLCLGDGLRDFGDRPELIPIEQQGQGRSEAIADERIKNGIHQATGLKVGKGFKIVRQHCTGCHSAKLITQNRADRQGWKEMITWMQETQGLWSLGTAESDILDYLSTYYAPKRVGRRAALVVEEKDWYWLEE